MLKKLYRMYPYPNTPRDLPPQKRSATASTRLAFFAHKRICHRDPQQRGAWHSFLVLFGLGLLSSTSLDFCHQPALCGEKHGQ